MRFHTQGYVFSCCHSNAFKFPGEFFLSYSHSPGDVHPYMHAQSAELQVKPARHNYMHLHHIRTSFSKLSSHIASVTLHVRCVWISARCR